MRPLFVLSLLAFLLSPLNGQVEGENILAGAGEAIEEEYHLYIKNNAELEMMHRRRAVILNDQSYANTVRIPYSPDEKLMDLEVKLLDISGQEIRKVRDNEINDYSSVSSFSIYEDDRVKHISLSHHAYPYVVEYSYRKRIRGIGRAALPDWIIYPYASSAILRSSYTVVLPADQAIHYRAFNLEQEPIITTGPGEKTYSWEVSNLPPIKMEPGMPYVWQLIPWVAVSPETFTVEDYHGSLSSWKSFGTFMHALYADRKALPESTIADIRALTADLPDEAGKVAAVYRYMQESTRYVSVQLGIGGWQPFEASYVDQNKYGDCKALSNYTSALLEAIGIESYPAVIDRDPNGTLRLEEDFALSHFNHVILYVPSTDMWLECTSKYLPAGYLDRSTQDRHALLVTPEGGRLARTPKLDADQNRQQLNADIKLEPDGAASLRFSGTYTGLSYESWMDLEYRGQLEDVKEQIREVSTLLNIDFGDISLQASPDSAMTHLAFEGLMPRYAARAGKRLFAPLNPICPWTYVPEALETRRYPVELPYGSTRACTIKLTLPEGFRVESLPRHPYELSTDFAAYRVDITEAEGGLVLSRELRFAGGSLPAERYDEYRRFLLDVSKYDAAKLVLIAED